MSLLLLLPAVAEAQFTFTTNNGTLTITGYTGPGGAVVIPGTIDGLPVTRIGNFAFFAKSLTSVTMPDSVTSYGSFAFAECTKLASVTFGKNVDNISYWMFAYCASLASITIPNGVTIIGDSAFVSCTSLTSISIPNSVTNIGGGAFASCNSLTSVAIPSSVTRIGNHAFGSCKSLNAITVDALNAFYSSVDGVLFNKSQTELIQYPGGKAGSYTIPTSVTSVGQYAFFYCTRLTSVTIPNSVTNIGYVPFDYCTSLSAITVDGLNSVYSSVDGVLFNKSQTVLIQYPGGKAGGYTIPNSVTSIGNNAFFYCTSLTGVTIPHSVTNIGYNAFHYCTSLNAITVDALNSVYSTVDGVLFNKSQTLLIQYPPGKAGSYTISNSVTEIGQEAFAGCTRLTSVTIPNSVGFISVYAFADCAGLTGLYFQGNAPFVDIDLFYNATNVTVYYLPGTAGWETTYSGRPTVLWNPRVDTSDASFGVRTNRFGFTITGASDLVLVVEAATSLVNPAWIPVGTNTLTGGSSYFSDPEWTNHSARFYRIRSP